MARAAKKKKTTASTGKIVTKVLSLNELVVVDDFLSLRPVNDVFVSRYRQAYRQGAKMPLMLVDIKTNEIVAGNHRYMAMLQEYGEDKQAEVEVRKFSTLREKLRAFAKSNVSTGNALSGISRRAISKALMEAGETVDEVAKLFDVSVKRVEAWGGMVVTVTGKGKVRKIEPIKKGPVVPEGIMTEGQHDEHISKDVGIEVVPLANQLCRWFQNGWVEKTDENIEALSRLKGEIENFL